MACSYSMIFKKVFTIVIITIVSLSCPSIAQNLDVQKQIDAMREQLQEVQSDTESMRNTLDELKRSNTDWLSEERAIEIRQLVQDILADADSRNSLVGDGLLGGWSNGFFLADKDDRFKLNIGGLMQIRFVQTFLRSDTSDRWRGGLENTRSRLDFSGHIFDRDTTFLIQAGFGYLDPNAILPNERLAGRLWDAWIKFKLNDRLSAKVGVFMLPFTRESLVSDKYQLAVDRSLIDYRLGLARSQGIELAWMPSDTARIFIATSSGSPTLRGIGIAQNNPTPPWASLGQAVDWSVTGRTEILMKGAWSQFNEFTSKPGSDTAMMFGVALHAQKGERTGTPGSARDQYGITADFSYHADGMTFFIAGTLHNQKNVTTSIPNADWVGYVAQASTYMTDTSEYFVRFESGGVMQDSLGNDDVNILTNGVNWYLDEQGLKITSDFGWSFGEISRGSGGAPGMSNSMVGWRPSPNQSAEWLFRTQLQLAF